MALLLAAHLVDCSAVQTVSRMVVLMADRTVGLTGTTWAERLVEPRVVQRVVQRAPMWAASWAVLKAAKTVVQRAARMADQ